MGKYSEEWEFNRVYQSHILKINFIPLAFHVWNIYLHKRAMFGVNIGKYSNTMEHLGIIYC